MRYWSVIAIFYGLIRPLFVRNIDPNEDYSCGTCGKPLLRRYIFCSKACQDAVGW